MITKLSVTKGFSCYVSSISYFSLFLFIFLWTPSDSLSSIENSSVITLFDPLLSVEQTCNILIIWRGLLLLLNNFWWMIHTRILWEDEKKMEKTCWKSSSTSYHLIVIFVTGMRLMTPTISVMHWHQLKIHGWLIVRSVSNLLSF